MPGVNERECKKISMPNMCGCQYFNIEDGVGDGCQRYHRTTLYNSPAPRLNVPARPEQALAEFASQRERCRERGRKLSMFRRRAGDDRSGFPKYVVAYGRRAFAFKGSSHKSFHAFRAGPELRVELRERDTCPCNGRRTIYEAKNRRHGPQ